MTIATITPRLRVNPEAILFLYRVGVTCQVQQVDLVIEWADRPF